MLMETPTQFAKSVQLARRGLPRRPKVTVRHAGEEPDVTVEPAGAAEIEVVDGLAEGTRAVAHKSVCVYRCWKDNDVLSDYWYATWPGVNWDSAAAFDIRDLLQVPEHLEGQYERLFPDNSEQQLLAYNIDAGHITEDGFVKPS